jgi:hypothetical protein
LAKNGWQRTVGKERLAESGWQRTVGKERLAKNGWQGCSQGCHPDWSKEPAFGFGPEIGGGFSLHIEGASKKGL